MKIVPYKALQRFVTRDKFGNVKVATVKRICSYFIEKIVLPLKGKKNFFNCLCTNWELAWDVRKWKKSIAAPAGYRAESSDRKRQKRKWLHSLLLCLFTESKMPLYSRLSWNFYIDKTEAEINLNKALKIR